MQPVKLKIEGEKLSLIILYTTHKDWALVVRQTKTLVLSYEEDFTYFVFCTSASLIFKEAFMENLKFSSGKKEKATNLLFIIPKHVKRSCWELSINSSHGQPAPLDKVYFVLFI